MRAEAHYIFVFAGDLDKDAARVMTKEKARLVHLCAGHFAMQKMIVLRRRTAIAQDAAVERKAAIGFHDGGCRARHGEAVAHGEVHAVEFSPPDHLAHEGQHDDVAALVLDQQGLYAAWIAKGGDAEAIGVGDHMRLLDKILAAKMKFDVRPDILHRDHLP